MQIIVTWMIFISLSIYPTESPTQLSGEFSNFQSIEKRLFQNEEILHLRLVGGINNLMKDRGDDHEYHSMRLEHIIKNDTLIDSIKVRTRGNFRRQKSNCKLPPLTLNFNNDSLGATSLFKGQTKLKLVLPCQGEKYVIREYLVYKLYNLINEYSFKVRLVRLTMYDTQKNKTYDPSYAFIIEDEDKMAARVDARLLKRDGIKPGYIESENFHKMAVFAYMIGNTDWSIQYRHNIKIIYPERIGKLVSVPYDFDLVGMVDAPYALPAQELRMRSVKQRRYRGYCLKSMEALYPIFYRFRELKESFYATFSNCTLLEEGYVKSMHQYLNEFYKTIDDPKKSRKAFLYPCDKYGTGNIVITGMPKMK
ncbi:MAG: hypothetical protein HKN68_22860 [Saprospiraceae bacterium]|nr:hypothetical protein [Saprospiraceae bacterium]